MVTGGDRGTSQVPNTQLNGMGYNPNDKHFYGWDLQNQQLIKLKDDITSPQSLTIPGSYTDSKTSVFSGDVDDNGHYWFFVGGGGGANNNNWYVFDLNTPDPANITPVSHSFSTITGNSGADWAYVPGTNSLYRAMDNTVTNLIEIWAFNRDNHQWTPVGMTDIPIGTDGNMGSVFADPNMNFYMSSNTSGNLFKIDLNDTPPFTSVKLDATDTSSNDGARCSIATVPVDYGDNPSSYGTLSTDLSASGGGARHSIIDFNANTSTAPLMLGNNIDVEDDGFPDAQAAGDDNDHEGLDSFVDDERGVPHIVTTPGTTDPITVPVRVTNNTATAATLAGWVDLDGNGTFESSERVTATINPGFVGLQELTFPAPASPYSTNTYSRFRLFSAADTSDAATSLSPTGPALGGEVEDVLVQVGSYDVTKTADPADGSAVNAGQDVTYTLTITNTGTGPLANLKIDDDLTDVLDDATVDSVKVDPSSAGSATVNGSTLEFVGDVIAGDKVTVSYVATIKEAGTLGNAQLNNYVYGVHSTSCDPSVNDGSASVDDPDCSTQHTVATLAATGSTLLLPAIAALALIGAGVAGIRISTRQP